LSRVACRKEFEQRFTAEIMATRYEAVYEALAARGRPLSAATSRRATR
jgi:hypothetical protein